MKSEIFNKAIMQRHRITFLYDFRLITLEPYYIGVNKNGNKVVYGKVNSTNRICAFEYSKITNIKVLNSHKFSPIIPILPSLN